MSILARIQIGHTHFAHSFLLKEEDPPQCISCYSRLIVKHIVFDCADFMESRNIHFNVNSFKVSPDTIFSYVHEIGLFSRLLNILRI